MTNQTNKPSFLLYKSFYEPVKHLTDQELGLLFRAIFDYQNGLEIKNLYGQVGMAFAFFKNQLDLDCQKYQTVIERNRSNGSKGGRPKRDKTQANPENPMGFLEPKKADKDKDKEIDKDKDKKKFTAPTLQEIQSYCQERRNSVDPKKFFDYYEASGWKDKDGKAVKNWKQRIISWEGRNGNQQQQSAPSPKLEILNTLAGSQIFTKIQEFEEEVHLYCASGMQPKASSLSSAIKEKIKAEFNKKITIR